MRSRGAEEIDALWLFVTVIVDKRAILRPPKDSKDIYREAVTRAVAHCVQRWPRVELFLDKRYTKRSLRHELERVIREGIADLPQEVVLIRQKAALPGPRFQSVRLHFSRR
jgi:hypothetical protein